MAVAIYLREKQGFHVIYRRFIEGLNENRLINEILAPGGEKKAPSPENRLQMEYFSAPKTDNRCFSAFSAKAGRRSA